MNPYVTGQTIQMLREKRRMTQKQLADLLYISDKTVSKWETGKGLPDIMLLEPLAKALHVSVPELFSGTEIVNQNRTGNMLKTRFYVCPVCGNVISAAGEGAFHCCGILLPPLEPEEPDTAHDIIVTPMDGEYYVRMAHPMTKRHFISFFAAVTAERVTLVKLYPEQEPETRLPAKGMNQFNLADDLMEPFRPVADLYVAANVAEDAAMTTALKGQLVNLLNADVLSGNQHHSVAYAMERMVQSLRGQTLQLPKLLEYKQHSYE